MRRFARVAVIGLAVWCGAVLGAQTPPGGARASGSVTRQSATPGGQVFRSGVEVITVAATVFDAEGRLAPDLPREAFELYDDGERQVITQFTHERVPVGLGLLLDVSDSMFGRRLAEARAAVSRFLFELLDPADEFFVYGFNHAPQLVSSWTRDAALVSTRLASLQPSGGTAVYDAVLTALPLFRTRNQPRAALVVISDGADTASDATLREVRSALIRSDAFVYAIAIDSADKRPINTRVNPVALGEITDDTGGRTQIVSDSAGLAAATQRIADELNSQYVLGYNAPHAADGEYHSIRVRVRDGGYRVRARRGYIGEPLPQKTGK
jgi:Ca-activated chloride channel family protein